MADAHTRVTETSMIGLALGTMAAFGVGRWLGASVVARWVPAHVTERFGFLLEAEGAVLAFVIYLIPGFPKVIVSYLFGMSPMPAGIFLVVSVIGRIPGTWVLSAQGDRTATGQYVQLAILTALTTAVAIPLYYYRHAILTRLRRSARREEEQPTPPPSAPGSATSATPSSGSGVGRP
jgi:uncharacterized membrane protein YdjX (TVP38/TMEM64 family)